MAEAGAALAPPDRSQVLNLYARLTAGVCVVTTRSGGHPVCATVSSVCSVSARPPLMSLCLGHDSRTLAAIRVHGAFALHLLDEQQRPWAELCADPLAAPGRRMAGQRVREVLGVPVVEGSLGWAVCELVDIRPYGDHCLVVGHVQTCDEAPGLPLLWHQRAFGVLGGTATGTQPEGGAA